MKNEPNNLFWLDEVKISHYIKSVILKVFRTMEDSLE